MPIPLSKILKREICYYYRFAEELKTHKHKLDEIPASDPGQNQICANILLRTPVRWRASTEVQTNELIQIFTFAFE